LIRLSLKFGILGLLSKWDATGYEIKKEFDDYMSIFWHSHLSQIYPELNKLEKEGLIEGKTITQIGKPDKKVYEINEAGADQLREWLLAKQDEPKIKDPFLMQVFFMDNISADDVIFQLKSYRKEREKRLHKLQQIMRDSWESIKEREAMSSRVVMATAVLKKGIDEEINYIKWCDETIELVEAFKDVWDDDLQATKKMDFATFEEQLIQYGALKALGE